jgi:hypothetical protein
MLTRGILRLNSVEAVEKLLQATQHQKPTNTSRVTLQPSLLHITPITHHEALSQA